MKVLVVVEDDVDMQLLIEVTLAADARLEVSGRCTTAAEAVAEARRIQPDLVILDLFIDGATMGLDAAPDIKCVAPDVRILLFTSHDLRVECEREPAVDEFLLKTHFAELVPTVQRLLGLAPAAA